MHRHRQGTRRGFQLPLTGSCKTGDVEKSKCEWRILKATLKGQNRADEYRNL